MSYNIHYVTPYLAKGLLDNFPSFSTEIQQFIISYKDELVKKAEEFLKRDGKTVVFPQNYILPGNEQSGYKISRDLSAITIQKDLASIRQELNHFIYTHKTVKALSELVSVYTFMETKYLYSTSDRMPAFVDGLERLISNIESYLHEYMSDYGLFNAIKMMNQAMDLILYKGLAVDQRISLISASCKFSPSSTVKPSFMGIVLETLFSTMKKSVLTVDDMNNCLELIYILGENRGEETHTSIIEELRLFADLYFEIRSRLNESGELPNDDVKPENDFITTLGKIRSENDVTQECYPVIYGDKTCIPANSRFTQFASFINSINLPDEFVKNPNSKLVTNFFGEFKKNYETCCIYNGTHIDIIVKIDGKIYLLVGKKSSNEIVLVELDPERYSYKNIYEVDIHGEYHLESGDLL